MDIVPIRDVLASAGLTVPRFNALVPDVANYSALLFQPRGEIDGNVGGVRSRNRALATEQFTKLLQKAKNDQADLTVTPEYSMPWSVLIGALNDDVAPALGQLWVLGCESIRLSELSALAAEQAPKIKILYEPLPVEANRFLDPLAYVFLATTVANADQQQIVIVVQFKTYPMGDEGHYEVTNLQRGTKVYEFGEAGRLRLLSIICSDALAFEDQHAALFYDRAMIIHIQLNPKPRHAQYRSYRDKLLKFDGNETELICLNWASHVCCWTGDVESKWKNESASAWYLRPQRFDYRDETLLANHRKGFYYTYLSTLRYHTMFLNYRPGVYCFEASKVHHHNVPAVVSNRRGPQLRAYLEWDGQQVDWVDQAEAEDGFTDLASELGDAKEDILRVMRTNPIHVERVLALGSGRIERTQDWHDVRKLESCSIDASEIVLRLTFCQDTHTRATDFRIGRLKLCKRLVLLLRDKDKLPPSIADFSAGFSFEWNPTSPHQNATSAKHARATVVYMGEQVSRTAVEATKAMIADYLARSFADADAALAAKQRLIVWYQDGDHPEVFEPYKYVQIDQAGASRELDIGRE